MLSTSDMATADPRRAWEACRIGEWDRTTAGICQGFAQANLVVLPRADAFDFLRFCQRNPKPCPLLEVTDPGDPEPKLSGAGSDLRTDLPRYRVYRDGQLVDERRDLMELWRDDLVAFLIGCSFSFEYALLKADIPMRHIELGTTVPMFRTNIRCISAGRFSGPMVVSMRPIPARMVALAVTITARVPDVHGAPLHVGAPEALGIRTVDQPDWGDPVPFNVDDLPVFWACGVTPQAVALETSPKLMITHAPGHMFVTKLTDEEVASH